MSTPTAAESALVIVVPKSESLVKPFRDRYDPSAAQGVPAHITLLYLYPFKPPTEIDGATLDTVLLDTVSRRWERRSSFPLESKQKDTVTP